MKSAFFFLVACVLDVSGYGGDACQCPVKYVRDYFGCSSSGYSGGKSCYYMGKYASHGGSLTGPTHTCTCNNGRWFNCYVNQAPVAAVKKNIVELAVDTPSLSTLVDVLSLPQYREILGALQGPGPFTVFAPTNAAFASAGVDVNDVDAVTNVLMYHVLSGKVLSNDLRSSQKVSTLQGGDVSITKKGSSVVVNGNAYVVLADVLATNGVVHVIDQVLKPPPPLPSIVDNAVNTPTLSTLVSVLSNENYEPLLTALSKPGTFTVFAPTNAAFAAAGIDVADAEAVTEVLKYHILPAEYPSQALSSYQQVASLEGSLVTIRKSTTGAVTVNDASVVVADVLSSNGVVHVIDRVLLPPAPTYTSCWYMGRSTQHGAFFTGPSHTCMCNDGSWVKCVRNV